MVLNPLHDDRWSGAAATWPWRSPASTTGSLE
jgi:hypothetical protein